MKFAYRSRPGGTVQKCVKKPTVCAVSTIILQEINMKIKNCVLKSRVFNHKAKMQKRTEITVVLDDFLYES
jgi:hypothetical protein